MRPGQILLAILLVASMLSIVNSSHQSRKLVAAIERADALGKRLDTEHRQLQADQSSNAKPALIDAIARRDLRMERPSPTRTAYLTLKDQP
jgi:cell division protein FtsL